MDVGSMMSALKSREAATRVANGLTRSRGNGMQTSATAATGGGRVLASSGMALPGGGRAHAVASAAQTGAAPAANAAAANAASSTSTASSTSGSNITSDDFLSLLVAEMKNQDPTQPTDPNAYIQQLVGVNSLQQLISINSELAATTGSTGVTGGGRTSIPAPRVTGGVTAGG